MMMVVMSYPHYRCMSTASLALVFMKDMNHEPKGHWIPRVVYPIKCVVVVVVVVDVDGIGKRGS